MEAHLLSPLLDPASRPRVSVPGPAGVGRPYAAGAGRWPGRRTPFWASRWTMPPARPSTRPPSCSACPTPAGRRWPHWRRTVDSDRFTLPRPMTAKPGLDFSFSGLKTQVRLLIEAHPQLGAPRRHRPRLRGRRGRHAAHQVPPRAGADRPRHAGGGRRRQRQSPPARGARRRRGQRRLCRALPAARAVHRQRRHGGLCRLPAPAGRRACRRRTAAPARAGRWPN